ncbi:MAG TPA: hypothetical protein VFG68_22610 [Fimbriiglobus sp.]|nr:hypothetical protein [Fimbriiglobus sp.]
MRRWWVVCVLVAVGCTGPEKASTELPLVEEFRAPPSEDRYNNPPEQGYRPPPPKKEFTPGMGTGPGPMMGGGGMGGRGF